MFIYQLSGHEQMMTDCAAPADADAMSGAADAPPLGENTPGAPQHMSADDAAFDAYSRTVIGAVDLVGPAVVSVHVGQQREDSIVAVGSGSGVIVTPDGYLLTNQHVVHRAARVSIRLTNGDTVEARVIAEDPSTDLAVLRAHIEPARRQPADASGAARRTARGRHRQSLRLRSHRVGWGHQCAGAHLARG